LEGDRAILSGRHLTRGDTGRWGDAVSERLNHECRDLKVVTPPRLKLTAYIEKLVLSDEFSPEQFEFRLIGACDERESYCSHRSHQQTY
jgi:hypothetical protein